MNESYNENEESEKGEKIDIRAIISKFLIHWKWIVASVIFCLICAWVYLRYTTTIYSISGSITIRDDRMNKSKGMGETALLEGLGMSSSTSTGIYNETYIITSRTMLAKAIVELGLYVNYQEEGRIGKTNLYRHSPINLGISAEDLNKIPRPASFKIDFTSENTIDLRADFGGEVITKKNLQLPAAMDTPIGKLMFSINPLKLADTTEVDANKGRTILATINSPIALASGYGKGLETKQAQDYSTVVLLSFKDSDPERGVDFMNKVIEIYNREANDDKNAAVRRSGDFINSRIGLINRELDSTEQSLQSYKQSRGLTNVASDVQLSLANDSEFDKKRMDASTQLALVHDLIELVNKPENRYETVPANVGISDAQVNGLISKYNEEILARKRLLRASSESHPSVVAISANLDAMLNDIKASLQNVYSGLLTSKQSLDSQASKYSGRISAAPAQERTITGIGRQQEIKSDLYLMLLQKREENAIALAATVDNAKVIDSAIADGIVSPKRQMIWLTAFILGLAIPIGIIFLLDLLRYKIEGHADVEKLTKATILGDIPLQRNQLIGKDNIVVKENENNIMTETFRTIRTNLQFVLDKPEKNVILITSTTSGEGKSFISSNMAVSLSLLGKKVVLVGLDVRKPRLAESFSINQKEGITNFLSNPQTDLGSVIYPSGVSENLWILPSGIIPPNPAELLSRPALADAINILRKQFDYVILDTAPVGMVSDTLIFSHLADMSIYVCRADYTKKSDIDMLNEFRANNKLKNVTVVINAIDLSKRKYGYTYGYRKRYGYGYGYGNESEHRNKSVIGQIKDTINKIKK